MDVSLAGGWDLPSIRSARRDQQLGQFQRPKALSAALKQDPALFAAIINRLAPQRGLPVELRAARAGSFAERVRAEGEGLFGPDGIGVTRDTLTSIDEDLVNHELAVGTLCWSPRGDGSRVDVRLEAWPLEHVWYDSYRRLLKTRTMDGEEVITHGDGRWVVFTQYEIRPWEHGALVPASLIYADRGYAIRDRAKASVAHGSAKLLGSLPEGMAVDSEQGQDFLALVEAIAKVDQPYGVMPAGSGIQYMVSNSNAWQLWSETIKANDVDAARIYLGSDGTIRGSGSNYKLSQMLFGIRSDLIEGSLRTLERGILTGIIEPWSAINFGDSTLAPRRVYLMPDADEDARRESIALRTQNYLRDLKAYTDLGDVDQPFADLLAADYGVRPVAVRTRHERLMDDEDLVDEVDVVEDVDPVPSRVDRLAMNSLTSGLY